MKFVIDIVISLFTLKLVWPWCKVELLASVDADGVFVHLIFVSCEF